MVGPISAYGMNPTSIYGMYAGYSASGIASSANGEASVSAAASSGAASATGAVSQDDRAHEAKVIKNPGESTEVQPGKKSSPAECQTCKERKYQDGSDEMVSFKSAAHLSPTSAASAVRAHEQEHVSNAYKKASQKDGKVVSCGVSIHTAICPECGRSYVSGGTTKTAIKYSNESNPYVKDMKAQQGDALAGANIDMAV